MATEHTPYIDGPGFVVCWETYNNRDGRLVDCQHSQIYRTRKEAETAAAKYGHCLPFETLVKTVVEVSTAWPEELLATASEARRAA
jgi:hypothetical protein